MPVGGAAGGRAAFDGLAGNLGAHPIKELHPNSTQHLLAAGATGESLPRPISGENVITAIPSAAQPKRTGSEAPDASADRHGTNERPRRAAEQTTMVVAAAPPEGRPTRIAAVAAQDMPSAIHTTRRRKSEVRAGGCTRRGKR